MENSLRNHEFQAMENRKFHVKPSHSHYFSCSDCFQPSYYSINHHPQEFYHEHDHADTHCRAHPNCFPHSKIVLDNLVNTHKTISSWKIKRSEFLNSLSNPEK